MPIKKSVLTVCKILMLVSINNTVYAQQSINDDFENTNKMNINENNNQISNTDTFFMNPNDILRYSNTSMGQIKHGYWNVTSYLGDGLYTIPVFSNQPVSIFVEFEIASKYNENMSGDYFFINLYNYGSSIYQLGINKREIGRISENGVPISFEKISFKVENISSARALMPMLILNTLIRKQMYIKSVKYEVTRLDN